MEKPEVFANLASGTQSLVVSFAVLVGGIWSAYTFDALKQVKIANAELTKAQSEVNKLALDIKIEAKQTRSLTSDRFGILMDVAVSNTGKRPIRLDLQGTPLSVSKIIKDNTNNLAASRIYTPKIYKEIGVNERIPLNWQQVQPGSTRIIEFYEEVDETGIYYISFNSTMDAEVQKMLNAREVGLSEQEVDESAYIFNPGGTWHAQKFIEIVSPNKAN